MMTAAEPHTLNGELHGTDHRSIKMLGKVTALPRRGDNLAGPVSATFLWPNKIPIVHHVKGRLTALAHGQRAPRQNGTAEGSVAGQEAGREREGPGRGHAPATPRPQPAPPPPSIFSATLVQ